MSADKCPQCGGDLKCLGGCSAHPLNWYCKDEQGCGWQAWAYRGTSVNELRLPEAHREMLLNDD